MLIKENIKILKTYLLTKSLNNEVNCVKRNDTLYSKHSEGKENTTSCNWKELLFHWSESNGSFWIRI